MSSIKLESNASGTGVFTIASPNSNTNRTLTLPDATGTIITTAGGAAISGTTGTFSSTIQGGSTISVGNATPSASGAGITFPATQSASSDANTLDDYEEGTWTPSIGGTATYTSQSGDYTRIGRMVFVRGVIVVNSIGTGSTTIISGLPFTVGNGNGFVDYWNVTNSSFVFISANFDAATTNITLYSATAAATALSGNAVFKNGTQVNFAGQYRV